MRGGLILSSFVAAAPGGDIRESLGDGAVSSHLLANSSPLLGNGGLPAEGQEAQAPDRKSVV